MIKQSSPEKKKKRKKNQGNQLQQGQQVTATAIFKLALNPFILAEESMIDLKIAEECH